MSSASLTINKCPICGATTRLVIRYEHVGGYSADQPVLQCENQRACWQRYDQQKGLTRSDLPRLSLGAGSASE